MESTPRPRSPASVNPTEPPIEAPRRTVIAGSGLLAVRERPSPLTEAVTPDLAPLVAASFAPLAPPLAARGTVVDDPPAQAGEISVRSGSVRLHRPPSRAAPSPTPARPSCPWRRLPRPPPGAPAVARADRRAPEPVIGRDREGLQARRQQQREPIATASSGLRPRETGLRRRTASDAPARTHFDADAGAGAAAAPMAALRSSSALGLAGLVGLGAFGCSSSTPTLRTDRSTAGGVDGGGRSAVDVAGVALRKTDPSGASVFAAATGRELASPRSSRRLPPADRRRRSSPGRATAASAFSSSKPAGASRSSSSNRVSTRAGPSPKGRARHQRRRKRKPRPARVASPTAIW